MGESYFWKPFAQGVATPIVLIGGTNLLLKDFKVSNPYLYWGGLAASSAIVVGILADKIKVPILNAESLNAEDIVCPSCGSDNWGEQEGYSCRDCNHVFNPYNAETEVFNASMYNCPECGFVGYQEEFLDAESTTFNADVKMNDRAWVAYYEYDFMNVRPENPQNITGDSKMVSFRDYRKELYGIYLTTQEAKKAFNLLKGSLMGHGDWKDGQYKQVINGYKQIYGGTPLRKTIPMQMKFEYVPIRRFGYDTALHTKTKNAETLDEEETWKNRENMSYFFVIEEDERGISRHKPYRTKEDAIKAGEKPDEIYEYRGVNSLSKEEREAQKKDNNEWYDREKQGEFFEDFWWKNEMSRYGNSDYERLHHSLYDSSTENDEKDGFYAKTILPSNPSEQEQVYNQSYAQELGISERLGALLNSSRSFGMYISQRAHPDTVKKYRQKILDGFDSYKPQSEKEKKIVEIVRENMATRGVKGPSPSYWSSSQGMLRKPELNYAYDDYYDNPIPFMGYELTDEEKKIIGNVKEDD